MSNPAARLAHALHRQEAVTGPARPAKTEKGGVMRHLQTLGLVAVAALFAGCGPYDVPVTRTLPFSVAAVDATCDSTQQFFDVSQDEDFQDNKSRISRIEIDAMILRITDPKTQPESVATKAHGSVRIAATSTGTPVKLGTYADVALVQDATRKIVVDEAGANRLVQLIQDPPYKAWVFAEGCVDQVPAYFDFEIEVQMTVFVRLF